MAGEWTPQTIDEITSRVAMGPFGSNIKTDNFVESGVPVIRGNNLNKGRFNGKEFVFLTDEKADELRNSNAFPGDLVFTHRGTLGQVGIIPSEPFKRYVVSQSQMVITCDRSKAEPLFLFYFFISSQGQHSLLMHTSQTGVPAISRPVTSLKSIRVPLPSIKEQQAIACILGALDDKIELNRRMNQTQEAMARAIFKSWFVDFDPVRSKADGGQPPGLAPHIADLFPDSFKESELGKIPKGWKAFNLPALIEINPTRRLAKGTKAPYLDMASMPTEGHCPESWIERDFGSGMRFMNGDTLVARITPCLENGKTAYVDFLKDNEIGWGSTEYIVLRSRESIPTVFAYLLARSSDFRSFAIQRMTGSSGRQRVPADSLATYQIASPPFDSKIFEAFGKVVNPYFMRIHCSVRETRILKGLRDALLPKLISGELQVPDVERIVKRCV